MRNDRSYHQSLGKLVTLQHLRVAEGQWALADAVAARSEAEDTERETELRLDNAARDYDRMLSSGLFDAHGFHLAGAIVTALEQEAGTANARADEARASEAATKLRWQRQSHRQDQLSALHTTACRRFARKEEEKALVEVTQLLMQRGGRRLA